MEHPLGRNTAHGTLLNVPEKDFCCLSAENSGGATTSNSTDESESDLGLEDDDDGAAAAASRGGAGFAFGFLSA